MPRLSQSHRRPVVSKPEYARWYSLPVWRRLRQAVLSRDAWVCQSCGNPAGESGNVDHREPHKGRWSLFVDMANLQCLCQSCHSRKSATE